MNPWILLAITFIGFSWPLLARIAKLGSITTALILTVATLITLFVGLIFVKVEKPVISGLIWVSIAGIINGIALIAYGAILSDNALSAKFVPILTIALVVGLTLGGVVFFGDSVSTQKVIGFALGVLGVCLLAFAK